MKTTVVKKLDDFYSRYLDWFQKRAAKNAVPWAEEDLPRFQSFHEDVYENDRIILNRMYYSIPLPSSTSLSGKLEIFSFSELNLLEKEGHEIVNICPVEYQIE